MIHRISQIITDFLISQRIADEKDYEIYVYGYEVVVSSLIDIMIVLLIGITFNRLADVLIIMSMFVSIRLYSGGYHANTYLKCKLLMTGMILIVLVISLVDIPFFLECIMIAFHMIIVSVLSPIENINKPIRSDNRIKYRITSIALSFLWEVASLIIYHCYTQISIIISCTGIFVSLLMIVAVIRKGGENNED